MIPLDRHPTDNGSAAGRRPEHDQPAPAVPRSEAMKILYIWDGDYPWDIRVAKICSSLQQAGHEVHIVCRNTRRQPRAEKWHGVQIHRLPCLPGCFGRLNNAFTFPAFFSPVWLQVLLAKTLSHDYQLIIVRDLPMAPAAILAGKIRKIPVIFDMAECYPEMLRCTWKFEGLKLKNIIVRNPIIADFIERMTLKLVDEIFVMIEESRDRLIGKNVDVNKIHIVSNTPQIDRFNAIPGKKSSSGGMLKLVYVGLLNPSRGLDTAIQAVELFRAGGGRIRFEIVGSGKQRQFLESLVKRRNLSDQVIFRGWVENSQVPAIIEDCDLGIVPHYCCSHWEHTIPNKLFDYMASGKPVIVSNVAPMARIVDQTRCGLVYPDTDPLALSLALEKLQDEKLREELGANGRSAVEREYNWNREEAVIAGVVNAFTASCR